MRKRRELSNESAKSCLPFYAIIYSAFNLDNPPLLGKNAKGQHLRLKNKSSSLFFSLYSILLQSRSFASQASIHPSIVLLYRFRLPFLVHILVRLCLATLYSKQSSSSSHSQCFPKLSSLSQSSVPLQLRHWLHRLPQQIQCTRCWVSSRSILFR